jgi:two-component system sensor histidine kinase UhpB
VVAFQDISERKQAELDLLESRRQLRELSFHLESVREEERTRIARELHDELGQMVTGLKLDVRWLASGLSGAKPVVMDKIASLSQSIDDTLNAMRRVAADLRPTMLDDLGLVAALEWLTEDFGNRTGLHALLELDVKELSCDCDRSENEMATAVFRIVQECLTNVVRHAQALHVRVFLGCTDGKLTLLVSDDGKGMDMKDEINRNSYGTIGMRERVHRLGGTFNLASAPGKGTHVKVSLPIMKQPVKDAR